MAESDLPADVPMSQYGIIQSIDHGHHHAKTKEGKNSQDVHYNKVKIQAPNYPNDMTRLFNKL